MSRLTIGRVGAALLAAAGAAALASPAVAAPPRVSIAAFTPPTPKLYHCDFSVWCGSDDPALSLEVRSGDHAPPITPVTVSMTIHDLDRVPRTGRLVLPDGRHDVTLAEFMWGSPGCHPASGRDCPFTVGGPQVVVLQPVRASGPAWDRVGLPALRSFWVRDVTLTRE